MSRIRVWVPEVNTQSTSQSSMTVATDIGISGKYYVELLDAKTQQVKRTWEFNNIITNNALNRILLQSSSISDFIFEYAVGSGSSTPLATNTRLDGEIAGRTGNNNGGINDVVLSVSASTQSGSYVLLRRTRVFSETQGNGTITEIGVFGSTTANGMFSRALILDISGSPTSIVKTNEEQLRVLYEIRLFLPNGDATGSFTWGTTTYDYVIRPVGFPGAWTSGFGPLFVFGNSIGISGQVAYASFSLVPFSASISGTNQSGATSVASQVYTPDSFVRTTNFIWNPTAANFAIQGFTFNPYSAAGISPTIQMRVVPPIVKNNLQRLDVALQFGLFRA